MQVSKSTLVALEKWIWANGYTNMYTYFTASSLDMLLRDEDCMMYADIRGILDSVLKAQMINDALDFHRHMNYCTGVRASLVTFTTREHLLGPIYDFLRAVDPYSYKQFNGVEQTNIHIIKLFHVFLFSYRSVKTLIEAQRFANSFDVKATSSKKDLTTWEVDETF